MAIIKRLILTAVLLTSVGTCALAQLEFVGTSHNVITEKPESSTGLNDIYIIYDTQGVSATYTAKNPDNFRWLRYSNLGGGYAEEVATTAEGDKRTITLGTSDMGYIIEDGTERRYYWVVNYANHHARLEKLTFAQEQECDRARLNFTGEAGKITYYTINGAAKELSRELTIDYYTLKYESEGMTYQQVSASQSFDYIDQTIGVFAPLCDTRFTLSGDKYLRTWKMEESVESDTYSAIAVEAQTQAEQETREVENEQKIEGGNLGGSAPVEVHFKAAVTDAAIFREWQMSKDPTFETIDDRFQQLDFDYTFRENGNIYVKFVANNAQGTCEYEGETYEVYIGEADLLCPNAFSPNGDGVNDEWRVSYKSIVEFDCHIFNRWGLEMAHLTNPAQGWDGKYNGKYVPTGVYYYVIKAKGADGRKYNRNGDINIIKSEKGRSSSAEE